MRRVKRCEPSKLDWDASLLPEGSSIVVALSGGADSLALLHVLRTAREKHDWDLVACHVHHGMRGEDAEEDVRFLQQTCSAWGISLEIARVDVPALATASSISVEEAGREARYAELGSVASRRDCSFITTAHTADDQAETVLMRLFRGAGIDGLAGIPRERRLHRDRPQPVIVRPLLDVWRRDIEAYCAFHSLAPRFDETNLDLRYRRSRIRHELMPQLEAFDPNVRAHLVRVAAQAASERELLTPAAEELLERAIAEEDPTTSRLVLNSEVLAAAEPALARRALRVALARLEMVDIEGESRIVERLLNAIRHETSPEFGLPLNNWHVRRCGARLSIAKAEAAGYSWIPEYELYIAGYGPPPESRAQLSVMETAPPAEPRQPAHRVYIDADSVEGALKLRFPVQGDRFRPLGAPGSRLLSDVFTDKKVKRMDRAVWPIVADDAGLLWVAGLAVAERCRVTEKTQRCFLFEIDPAPIVP